MNRCKYVAMVVIGVAAAVAFLSACIDNGTTAAEPSETSGGEKTSGPGHNFPETAFEYAFFLKLAA